MDVAGALGSKLDLGGVKESNPNEVFAVSKCPEVGLAEAVAVSGDSAEAFGLFHLLSLGLWHMQKGDSAHLPLCFVCLTVLSSGLWKVGRFLKWVG